MITNYTAVAPDRFSISRDHRFEFLYQAMAVLVPGQEVCQVSRKLVVNHYAAATGFVECGDFYAVAKTAFASNQTKLNILHYNVVVDVVIGNVVADVMNVNVAANDAIVNGCIVNTAIFHDSSVEGHGSGVVANADISGKLNVSDIFRNKIRVYLYLLPVVGITSLLLKFCYFCIGELPVFGCIFQGK